MQLFTIFELLLTGVGTLYLLKRYPAKDVSLLVKVVCFISWFLSFATLILLPLDVYYTLKESADGTQTINLPKEKKLTLEESFMGMITIWQIVYWTNFFFTWVLLPFLQEYVDAGEFTVKDKIIRSLKMNGTIYGILGGLGLIFIMFLTLTNRIGGEGILHFLITFANCFGIVLIILCLSYGLVFVPKRCFQQTRPGLNLQTHQFQAAMIEDQRSRLLFRVSDLIKDVQCLLLRDDITPEDKQTLRKILEIAPDNLVYEVTQMLRSTNLPTTGDYDNFTKSKMAQLHKRMRKRVKELQRLENKWDHTLRHAMFLQDIMDSKNPTEWRTKPSYKPSEHPKYERILSAIEWVWHAYLSQVFFFLLGAALVVFSGLVFIAEILNFDNLHILNIESFITDGSGAVAKSQVLCLIPLFYISLCVYSALFNMKFAGRYGLYKNNHTDAASLIFSSVNFSRVSAPLVLNFLQMLKLKGTAFHHVMGEVNFAYSFMRYFPLILLVLIMCNVFNVYGRILNSFGLGRFKFDEETTRDRVEEGKILLNKARHNLYHNGSGSNGSFERQKGGDEGSPDRQIEESITATGEDDGKKGRGEHLTKGYVINTNPKFTNIRKSLQDL